MYLAAARGLGDPAEPFVPAFADLRRAAVEIAFALGEQAVREGWYVASFPQSLRNAIISWPWAPVYPSHL